MPHPRTDKPIFYLAILMMLLLGCGTETSKAPGTKEAPPNVTERDTVADNTAQTLITPDMKPVATCAYDNPFSKEPECREYFGAWSDEALEAACGKVFTGVAGTLSADDPCSYEGAIGTCTSLPDDDGLLFRIWHYGGEEEVTKNACQNFLNGVWTSGDGDAVVERVAEPSAEEQALLSMKSTEHVTVVPECTDAQCLSALVDAREGISFTPTQSTPEVGFILYPGALVDPRAYAPLAQRIASEDILTVIVPMPGNFALSGWDRALDIIAAFPNIERWYLGGHSMGGAMSIHFAVENPDTVKGLVLWAAYPGDGDDLSESGLPIMSIYGSHDGVVTEDEIAQGQPRLPGETRYIAIPGGNHAQFGLYGDQEGDLSAEIPPTDQHQQVSAATVHFIRTIEAGDNLETQPQFSEVDNLAWCAEAQKTLAPANVDWDGVKIEIDTYDSTVSFAESKPSLDTEIETKIQLQGFLRYHGNAAQLSAPPILVREVWCKLKSSEIIAQTLQLSPSTELKTCADINAAVIKWATSQLSVEAQQQLQTNGPEVIFDPDTEFSTGAEWLSDGLVDISASPENNAVHIRSATLKVGNDEELPEAFRNVVYCKLLAPSEALNWAMDVSQAP